ncbi:hypothetical protein SAMN04489724_0955 [Algoriphagus locisalis]|uniref:DUF3829 domain-containing protein n=1 Tax=Algoriphagus locisalis TaxID=305507 RepID=A0A1I6YDY5_9BACT|nr:hypothetical protein [Algoriphagus locisalis]SFT48612.1 hypothetical protein SAMN04489724_0955 [Algoriphagus locisalis]
MRTALLGKMPPLVLVTFTLFLFSCVNLKSVGEFSVTSTESLKNFEKIDYSFLQHCLDRCTDEAIRKYEIKRAQECSCELYQEADSVTQVIYNTIEGYFEGLGHLSQNELTTYSSDAVVNALTAEEFGPVQIDSRFATAFSSLSNTLLRATTDSYRRKKTAQYIEEANESMQVLLEKFEVIISTNLKGELRFKRERLYAYYMDMKMNQTVLSEYEKGQAATDYYQALEAIQRKELELEVFGESLAEIAKGHQVLYDNRNKLSVKNLQELLQEYSSHVKELVSEFNKLNN